ncbi:MAG: deoxyribonuclease V [Thermodesulfovibrionales bacterium]
MSMDLERLLAHFPRGWPGDVAEARAIQEAVRLKVRVVPLRGRPRTVAGLDAAFAGDRAVAAACLFTYPGLEPIKDSVAVRRCEFPYVPGYLTFREGPAVVEAIAALGEPPGLLLFDGQGIAHPRGIGIAAHLGALMDLPSVGCAKSRLAGQYREPGRRKGSWSPLRIEGRAVGAALRTRDGVKPVFVSPGHRIDLAGSLEIVMGCVGRFRVPEPLRRADMTVKRAREVI